MSQHTTRRRKPELSPHQKQMRFFTRFAVILCTLVTLAALWLLNRTGYPTH